MTPTGLHPVQTIAPCLRVEDELAADVEDSLHGSTDLVNLHGAAERLKSQPHRILAKIRFIREDNDLLEALAERSLRHSNGFTKVKLVAKEKYSVRLHLWSASETERVETNPHGHRWEFASWVVCGGGMIERTYAESGPSDPLAHAYDLYHFGSAPGGGRVVLPQKGAWLAEIDRFHRSAGAVYACQKDTVHTAAPAGNDFVATVVVQGNAHTSIAPVYAPYGRCPKAREGRVSASALRADLIVLEQMLQRNIDEDGHRHAVHHVT